MRDSLNPRWPSGVVIDDAELTEAQWDTLVKLQERFQIPQPMTVLPGLDYIGIYTPFGLFIGIEKDGYHHT